MEISPMTSTILQHYNTSPYAEKVWTGLGLKGLAWASVELPVIMPKPNLTALTGDYRKPPVLQIGAGPFRGWSPVLASNSDLVLVHLVASAQDPGRQRDSA
jgi:glutathione S-transferase